MDVDKTLFLTLEIPIWLWPKTIS